MISRKTIFTLLLALLLAGGIQAWSVQHVDPCSGYQSGVRTAPSDQVVETGSRSVLVPCTRWFTRQPVQVQLICFADGLIGLVCFVSFIADLKKTALFRQR